MIPGKKQNKNKKYCKFNISDGFKDHRFKDQGKARSLGPRTKARQGLKGSRTKARQGVGGQGPRQGKDFKYKDQGKDQGPNTIAFVVIAVFQFRLVEM